VTDVAGPRERDEQSAAGLEARCELRAQLGDGVALVERQRARGRRDVCRPRLDGRRGQDLDAVDQQRALRLGGERRDQLGLGARREGRLGEAAQGCMRDVRSDARGDRQGIDCLRPKGLPFISASARPVLIGY